MTREQIEAILQQLAGAVAIAAPGHAALIGAVLPAATTLNNLLRRSRTDDPEAWAEVAIDHNAAWDAWEISGGG